SQQNGTLTIQNNYTPNSALLIIRNALSFNNAILNGPGTILLIGAGFTAPTVDTGSTSLTIGAGMIIQGRGTFSPGSNCINHGNMLADEGQASPLTIQGGHIANKGTIGASDHVTSGALIANNIDWDNTGGGKILIDPNSTFTLNSGNIRQGTLFSAGQTFLNG